MDSRGYLLNQTDNAACRTPGSINEEQLEVGCEGRPNSWVTVPETIEMSPSLATVTVDIAYARSCQLIQLTMRSHTNESVAVLTPTSRFIIAPLERFAWTETIDPAFYVEWTAWVMPVESARATDAVRVSYNIGQHCRPRPEKVFEDIVSPSQYVAGVYGLALTIYLVGIGTDRWNKVAAAGVVPAIVSECKVAIVPLAGLWSTAFASWAAMFLALLLISTQRLNRPGLARMCVTMATQLAVTSFLLVADI